jgi:hypothetical protein
VAADLSSAVLLLSLDTARRRNPSFEWKWKQVEAAGPRIDLMQSGPSNATGGRASTSTQRKSQRPSGLVPSTYLLPKGSFRPNDYLAVTSSSVREFASAALQATFRPTWTRYAPL